MNARTNPVGTTQSEAEVLAATAAALEAGGDPFGDDDTDAPAAADDADENPTAADENDDEAAQGATLHLETVAVVAGADDEPAAAQEAAPAAAPRYKAGDPAEFKAQRAELTTEKAKALSDLMAGVIEPDEYSRIEAEVADKLEAMTVQRTLHEANVQSDQQVQGLVLDGIMKAAKEQGVDYAGDQKAARQFDAAMAMLAEPGDTRGYAQQAADAHKAVLAIRGVKAVEPVAPAAKPRENGKGPMTLRNVPAAAVANTGGGWMEQLSTLSGQDYEAAFARLTPAQRAQLMND